VTVGDTGCAESADLALAARDVEKVIVSCRLVVVTRDSPTAPALGTFLAALRDQAHRFDHEIGDPGALKTGVGSS
jgi:hypothetical protein